MKNVTANQIKERALNGGPLTAILSLDEWLKRNNYQGYEPFDGLQSPLRVLTFENRFALRLLQQAVLRMLFNFRPALGIKRNYSTKGMGYLTLGYLKLFKATKDEKWARQAVYCLNWLRESVSPGYHGACWGNHFDYISRAFYLPKFTPTTVWTSLIGHAFVEGYETLGNKQWLEIAESVCEFIIQDLPREEFGNNCCLSYVPFKQASIHNANMLAASLLIRVHAYSKKPALSQLAKMAISYSVARQRVDGSWYYGEEKKYHWIDNWHTAYKIDSLKWYIQSTGEKDFSPALEKGYSFFKHNFFTPDYAPKFHYNRLYPLDIQCASQAIDTFCFFSDYDAPALEMAGEIANWTIKHMQELDGHFCYRILPFKKVKIPMLHWGQATMMSALSHLLYKESLKKPW